MRKGWLAGLSIAFLAIAALGYAGPSIAAIERLSVTYVASPLNIPSIVEKRENRFESAFPGVQILLPDLSAGPQQTAAMAAGEVDFAHCLGATSAILAASEGLDVRIVGIYSRAPKAFMIVTRDERLKGALDLKGKKIGGPKGTILHQLLAAATAEVGLKPSDYEFINMGIPAAAAALSSGSIDAALLAGADAYRAVQDGAIVLLDGVGNVDATTVIATTQTYLGKHADVAARFLDMHAEAVRHIRENEDACLAMTAEETRLPMEAVEAMYPWYDFSPEIRESDIEELKRTQDFLLENGLQRNRIDIEAILVK